MAIFVSKSWICCRNMFHCVFTGFVAVTGTLVFCLYAVILHNSRILSSAFSSPELKMF